MLRIEVNPKEPIVLPVVQNEPRVPFTYELWKLWQTGTQALARYIRWPKDITALGLTRVQARLLWWAELKESGRLSEARVPMTRDIWDEQLMVILNTPP
jgi:hypothetical protein